MPKNNLLLVVNALSFFSWKQRKDIVRETGLARSTVYDSLVKIDLAGILEIKQQPHGKGRPHTLYRLIT